MEKSSRESHGTLVSLSDMIVVRGVLSFVCSVLWRLLHLQNGHTRVKTPAFADHLFRPPPFALFQTRIFHDIIMFIPFMNVRVYVRMCYFFLNRLIPRTLTTDSLSETVGHCIVPRTLCIRLDFIATRDPRDTPIKLTENALFYKCKSLKLWLIASSWIFIITPFWPISCRGTTFFFVDFESIFSLACRFQTLSKKRGNETQCEVKRGNWILARCRRHSNSMTRSQSK